MYERFSIMTCFGPGFVSFQPCVEAKLEFEDEKKIVTIVSIDLLRR
jgi:hypothetical protein